MAKISVFWSCHHCSSIAEKFDSRFGKNINFYVIKRFFIMSLGWGAISKSCVEGGSNGFLQLHTAYNQWPNLSFLMLQPILRIIFDFSKIFYARIYHFQNCFNQKIFCYGPMYVQWQQEVSLIPVFAAELEFFDILEHLECHIRLPRGFLHQNLSISKMF